MSQRAPRAYRDLVGAKVATTAQAQAAGRRGRSYLMPDGSIVSRRQLEQRAATVLGLDWRTLEQRSNRLRGEHPPNSYVAAVRFWAAKHNLTYQQAQRDLPFLEAWKSRLDRDRGKRVAYGKAYRALGIIEKDSDGNWKYTEAFMRFLLER